MLRHLSQQHQVTLVSFVRADDRPEFVEHLAQFCRAVHTVPIRRSTAANMRAGLYGMVTGLPIVIARDHSPEMAALLRRLAQDSHFDVIHADQLSMAAWAQQAAEAIDAAEANPPPPSFPQAQQLLRALRVSRLRVPARLRGPNSPARLRGPNSPRLLLDAHNAIYKLTERMAAESQGLRRWITQREARAFRRYERDMLRRFDAVLAVTDEDRALLLDLFPEPERSHQAAKFTTVPICIDPTTQTMIEERGTMTGEPPPDSAFIVHPSPSRTPTILHLGTMFWPPNVAGVLWFARDVLPLIWRQVPEARFVVVGKNPPPEVCALASDARIEVTGYVADPQPYLQAADVFVAPLHSGGGMRVKILDAWLWGLPIVSTPIGAEGIDLVDGETILLAGDAAAFAAATLRLLTDRALNQRLRRAGRRWVEQTYAWQVVYRRVDALLG
jgi:glycosyltransferase involved in cell wall biosynthesis